MSKFLCMLGAVAVLAVAALPATSAQAALICTEDGCEPAIILPSPVLLLDDDCD